MVKTSSEKPWYSPMFVQFLMHDAPRLLGCSQQLFARDVITFERRLANEGEGFLTKTLPSLGKVIDLALQGHIPLATPNFKKRGRSALPAFLSALLRRVFTDDGWIRSKPCITSIRLLRQATLWFKKIKKGYSDESLQKATADFIEVDRVLPDSGWTFPASDRLLTVARMLVVGMLRDIASPTVSNPGHGPGAVAGGEGLVGKRALDTSYDTLESVFRPIPWFYSLRDAAESPGVVLDRPKKPYGLSKIAFVEKDSSGPRIIGLEPSEYMWCQQALKKLLYHHIETKSAAQGQINFTDQSVNRELARNWQGYVTLDLSKASDRVSLALVEQLWKDTRLYRWMLASRTPGTVLPDKSVLMYKKFAPMGSAMCFPVMAISLYAIAVAAQHLAGMPIFLACRKTFVYGDDLIVVGDHWPSIDCAFQALGLKLNAAKCCVAGKFRESCGMDAYDGQDVTPVRMGLSDVNTPTDFIQIVEHSNSLAQAGYWCSSEGLRVSAYRRYPFLNVLGIPSTTRPDLPILAWLTTTRDTVYVRFDKRTLLHTVKGWAFKPKRLVMPEELEVRHLRESLCRVGPVGHLVKDVPRSVVRRELDARYVGMLRRKKFVVQPEKGPDSVLDRGDNSPKFWLDKFLETPSRAKGAFLRGSCAYSHVTQPKCQRSE